MATVADIISALEHAADAVDTAQSAANAVAEKIGDCGRSVATVHQGTSTADSLLGAFGAASNASYSQIASLTHAADAIREYHAQLGAVGSNIQKIATFGRATARRSERGAEAEGADVSSSGTRRGDIAGDLAGPAATESRSLSAAESQAIPGSQLRKAAFPTTWSKAKVFGEAFKRQSSENGLKDLWDAASAFGKAATATSKLAVGVAAFTVPGVGHVVGIRLIASGFRDGKDLVQLAWNFRTYVNSAVEGIEKSKIREQGVHATLLTWFKWPSIQSEENIT